MPSTNSSTAIISLILPQEALSRPGDTYIFNHVHLILSYHRGTGAQPTDGRLVRAQVQLASCANPTCAPRAGGMVIPKLLSDSNQTLVNITYTYTVEFREAKEIHWAKRWDYILSRSGPSADIQQQSLINSISVMLFVTILLAIILAKSMYCDPLNYYNKDGEDCVS